MIVSMTGFASTTLTLSSKDRAQTHLTFMLKSLNARFFEATCKLPYALSSLETEFIKFFKQKLYRGNVIFITQVDNPAFFKGPAHIDLAILQGYLTASEHIKEKFAVPGTLTIADLINLPNIFTIEEQTIDATTKQQIFQAVEQLVNELINARKTEGKALFDDLQQRIKKIYQEIGIIETAAANVMQKQKQLIATKFTDIDKQLSPEVIETQRAMLYLELDKIDIHEEITRINNHLKTFSNCLADPDTEKGRRLDFILQELGREINTIAAKCSDATMSTHAINIKVELEKAREQVQNVV